MNMYEDHLYDMFCEVNVSYSIQRNAHKDILIFWHLPHYYNTVTLFAQIITTLATALTTNSLSYNHKSSTYN